MKWNLILWTSIGVLTWSSWTFGQNQPINLPTGTGTMPGQVVGSSLPRANVMPSGSRLPGTVPQAGSPVGQGPGGIPPQLDPRMPNGRPFNPQNVVAPYPMQPKPEPGFWESLYNRWAMLFGSDTPAQRPTNFTPGISRRNKERNANNFRRD